MIKRPASKSTSGRWPPVNVTQGSLSRPFCASAVRLRLTENNDKGKRPRRHRLGHLCSRRDSGLIFVKE